MRVARFIALAIFASLLTANSGIAAATCAGASAGGDWRSYGHDAANTRTQPQEDGIGVSNVGAIAKTWAFHAVDGAGTGSISSTPVVADGCVYVTSSVTNAGALFALNADTGELVWAKGFDGGEPGALVGGAAVGSPTVYNGVVYMLVSKPGAPYVMALDSQTGVQLWTAVIATDTADAALNPDQKNTFINASPIVVNGLLIVGFSGYEALTWSRGGWSIFDANTGALLGREYTVPDDEYNLGHGAGGASVWGSPAVDPIGGWIYLPTGNPSSAPHESRLSNSLLKVDARDPSSQSFGSIVSAFHGEADSFVEDINSNPACQDSDLAQATRLLAWSISCGQLDLDFGSTPNLFTDSFGNKMLGDLQKSGVYHAVYADTMSRAWDVTVGAPCLACNASSPATDSNGIYVVGTPGGQLFSLSFNGGIRWVALVGDGIHYQSVSTANGVVYTVDGYGFLNGWDASNGQPVLKRQIGQDTGNNQETNQGSSGVAIARHTIYAAVNGWVVAYK